MLKQSFLHEGATGMFGSADARVNPLLILLMFPRIPTPQAKQQGSLTLNLHQFFCRTRHSKRAGCPALSKSNLADLLVCVSLRQSRTTTSSS